MSSVRFLPLGHHVKQGMDAAPSLQPYLQSVLQWLTTLFFEMTNCNAIIDSFVKKPDYPVTDFSLWWVWGV